MALRGDTGSIISAATAFDPAATSGSTSDAITNINELDIDGSVIEKRVLSFLQKA